MSKRTKEYFIEITTRAWNSPTLTTWGSYISRIISLAIVLPLILTKFSTADIALWYLFLTIIGMQPLADMGFGVTFIRIISYAMGGTDKLDDLRNINLNSISTRGANWHTIEKIVNTMYYIYARLTPLLFILLLIFGTAFLFKPISYTGQPTEAWISWAIILMATTIIFRGSMYSNYLQGINKIALLRRWQAVFSLGSIFSNFLILWFDGSILLLVISNQFWAVLNVIRNYYFCRNADKGQFKKFAKQGKDEEVLKAVWPSAWRSGVGVLLYYGTIQASGLIYAQIGDLENIAAYLLSIRILNNIRGFSQAPFYSKIPLLARLRAQGNIKKQIAVARQGMQLSYWTFALAFIIVGISASPLLNYIGSNANFASPLLWILLGFGYYVERFGAMHIQLYSTTNHIIWHIANGISGAIYLLFSFILLPYIDVYAFPIAIIIAQLGFFSWYTAWHSYKTFNLRFWDFEKYVMLQPLGSIILYMLLMFLVNI
jgi:O-antigen/teichoic acid export membrane protein